LDNLVFQCRNAEGSLTTIGLGDVHAAHRLRPVPSAVYAIAQVLQLLRQTLFVGCDRFPVDSRCRASLQPTERSSERLDITMQQRVNGSWSCQLLVDSRERWRRISALRPVLRALAEFVRGAPSSTRLVSSAV
jgi:hypothetical protein